MKKIAFVFDRVTHYHRSLFCELEGRFDRRGIELHLYSGLWRGTEKGRVGLVENVVERQHKHPVREKAVGTFMLNHTFGYLPGLWKAGVNVVVCPAHPGNVGHWLMGCGRQAFGFKLVSWLCGYEPNPGCLKKVLASSLIPRFDHHLAYHTNARRYALAHGAAEDEVTVMHNTINEERIAIRLKEEALAVIRSRHPELGGRRIVLYVGAILADKRVEQIADGVRDMGRGDAVLLVVGDGPHLPALKAYTQGRLEVVYVGEVLKGVGDYFDAAEVFVMPGTGGLALNEAMAHSLPIIVGEADGSADDLVVHGENGLRLREGTAAEIREHLLTLFESPELGETMGRKGREWITGRFSFQSFLDRIETCLLQQLG